AHASEYNDFIVRVVPRYWQQLECLLEYSPALANNVLELGCGSGNVSLRLAERWTDATMTFVDAAPEMLALTRARLKESEPRIEERAQFLSERFEELSLEPGTIDVVVASLSLHHVQDVSIVYNRIAPMLVTGGRLVMLDGVRGLTDREHDVHMARWASYWQEPGNLSEDEIRDMREHIALHDHYRSLREHFEMLTTAGFTDPDCVWRDGVFALVTATRA
ncbi:MAG TPA: class I SAM-dependent methyltransferase, partial [Longimicrobiales bacterium]|nr:class I SAM-dependent methyltransferase [Longimicrobiales bacterium]